jgi:hypothetical protein
MKTSEFAKLNPEEVQALTGKDLERYNAWLLKQQEAAAAANEEEEEEEEEDDKPKKKGVAVPAPKVVKLDPKGMKAHAADYFDRHENSLLESVHVVSDGTIFPGTPHGKNACINYVNDGNAQAKDLTSLEVGR